MTGGLPSPSKPATKRAGATLMLVLLFVTSLLVAPAAASQVHPGIGDRLEAEWFNVADAACDPDFDGEPTEVHEHDGSSGGAHVFLPHSGCGLSFNAWSFAEDRSFTGFRVAVGGSDHTYSGVVRVLVDGAVVAEGHYSAHHSEGMQTYVFEPSPSAVVTAGVHDIRVEFRTTSGPFYGNLFIDHLDTATTGGGGGGGGPPLPDLQVTFDSLLAEPYDPSQLKSVFRIHNAGESFAEGFAIDVWYDGLYAGQIDHPFPLGPGHTTWNALPWPFTTGAHTIKATIDPDGTIAESNETNNDAHHEIPVDTPEAYINLVWEPSSIDANGFSVARFSVFSTGTAPMPATTVEVRLNGTVRASAGVPALGIGQAVGLAVPFPAEPGEHRMSIVVDPDEQVTELEERRNTWRMHVDLQPAVRPDLEVLVKQPDLAGRQYGDVVDVEAVVSNSGDGATTSTRATWTIGDETRVVDVPQLAPGETQALRTQVVLTPGVHEVGMRVDPVDGETDLRHNEDVIRFDVGVPALHAIAIEIDEEVPEEGVPVDLTATFAYNGTLGLRQARAALYDGDRLLTTWDLHDLTPGAEEALGLSWSPKEGEHRLRFVVEAADVREPALADNEIERNVTVRGPSPAACRDAGLVTGSDGLRESCRRILLGEEDPLGPL